MLNKRQQDITVCLLAAIPAIIYVFLVYAYAFNMPYQDDYDAILNFLSDFKKATFSDKAALLFHQHNEHRIFFARLVSVLHYSVFGEINFRHLILLNAALLLGIFALCFYFIRKCLPNGWHIPVLVLSLGLFDLNNFENALTSLAGVFNYSVIFLFLFSIFLYSHDGLKFLIPAAIVQAVTVYSGGNGIIASFFIVAFTVFSKYKKQAIVSSVIFLITAPLYYYKYEHGTAVFFTSDMYVVSRIFFNGIGANFGTYIGFFMGLVLLTVFVWALPVNRYFKFRDNSLPLLCLAGFMIASILVMSYFRGKLPVEAVYSSRYLIYTHLLFAVLCVFLFLRVDSLRLQFAFLAFSIFFYLLNYNTDNYKNIYVALKHAEFYYPREDLARQSADRACSDGIYCIEKHRLDRNWYLKDDSTVNSLNEYWRKKRMQ